MNTHKIQVHRYWGFYVLVSLFLFLLPSCGDKNYSSALAELREELKQTNDTIYAYSVKNHYALWIHTDKPNEQVEGPSDGIYSLYYYDLETKVKERLFTTRQDSLKLMPTNEKHVVDTYFQLHFSEDSCALIIEDGTYVSGNFIFLYPLTGDRKTIHFLSYDKLEDVQFAPNEYVGVEFVDLSYGKYDSLVRLKGSDITWPPTRYRRKYLYNTKGEIINTDPNIYVRYGNYPMREFNTYRIPKEALSNPEQLAFYVINTRAYRLEDVYHLANNRIKFEELFDNEDKQEFFMLSVETVEKIGRDDDYTLFIKGEGFTITSNDMAFAELNYPCNVIIKANVVTVESLAATLSNPLALYLFSAFATVDSNLYSVLNNVEGDFVFSKASFVLRF